PRPGTACFLGVGAHLDLPSCPTRRSSDLFKYPRKAGPLAIRPRLPKARQTHHDQTWIDAMQSLDIQTPAIQAAGTKVLDQHIKTRNQLQENFPAAWLAYIQGDALLAAIGHLPPQ